jgi:hypothetical protein
MSAKRGEVDRIPHTNELIAKGKLGQVNILFGNPISNIDGLAEFQAGIIAGATVNGQVILPRLGVKLSLYCDVRHKNSWAN